MIFVNSKLSRTERERLVAGYKQMVRDHIKEGKEPYFINFMFNQLPGRTETKKEIMRREVMRVHDILSRNVVRKPASDGWKHLKPAFVGCPDNPVPKAGKTLLRDAKINDGLHFNVLALVPPRRTEEQLAQGKRCSRLGTDLVTHITEHPEWYLSDALDRIHVTPVKFGTMVDYTFKAFLNGRIGSDDILVR